MLKATVQKAINEQINKELYSAYLYLSMAAYCEDQDLPGFAHWMSKQASEEMGHALKLYGYVNERQGRVTLAAIAEPPAEFDGALDVFEKVYAHEIEVTASINSLYETALDAKDYATQSLLKWFIDEQVEEEASASQVVAQLKMSGGKGQALIMLDRALAAR